MQQMTLNVTLRDGLQFGSFFETLANQELLARLQQFSVNQQAAQLFVWGGTHSGKSHLLQACCYQASDDGQRVSYLPLKSLLDHGVTATQGLDGMQLIVVDDVDIVLGNRQWEVALFDLINQTRSHQQRLLLSASQNPRHLQSELPDLASRLIWGESYALHALSGDEKNQALRQRATQRGLVLSDRVIEYLNRHYPRDMGSMLTILEVIDHESLRQHAKITVPFVKQILDS